MTTKRKPLKAQHQLFLKHYLSGNTKFNGQQSAIKAGYSPASARTQQRQILQREDVQAEIERIQGTVPEDVELEYAEFIEVCSTRIRGNGRDATTWAALLAKAKGWGLETTRVLHDQLPPPTLVLPSAVGIAGQDPAPKQLTEQPTVIEVEVKELSPTAEPGENKQPEASESAQVVEVQDVETVKPS